jgi:hypothetical protein
MNVTRLFLTLALLGATTLANAQVDTQKDSQAERPAPNGMRPGNGKEGKTFLTHEQMTSKMVTELKLNDKQAKKLKKLNKKYASLIEGPQHKQPSNGKSGGMAMGGPQGGPGGNMGGGMIGGGPGGNMGGGMVGGGPQGQRPQGFGSSNDDELDLSGKKQEAYEKKLKSILSDSQYEGYKKIKPTFASQVLIKQFLLGK